MYTISWTIYRRNKYQDLILLVALIPIGIQFAATYSHTGELSYLSPKQSQKWQSIHLSSTNIGYDTIVKTQTVSQIPLEEILTQRHHLPASFGSSGIVKDKIAISTKYWKNQYPQVDGGFLPMWEALNYYGLISLALERINFYFGSYASKTYLSNSYDRFFSALYLVFNIIFVTLAIVYLTKLIKQTGITGISINVMIGLIIAEALLIIPEQRFIIAFQTLIWLFAYFQIITMYFTKAKPIGTQYD